MKTINNNKIALLSLAIVLFGSAVASADVAACYRHSDGAAYQALAPTDPPNFTINGEPVSNLNYLAGLPNATILRGGVAVRADGKPCTTVNRGTPFIRSIEWFTAITNDSKQIYPPSYSGDRQDPFQDFRNKLVGMIYQIDGGPTLLLGNQGAAYAAGNTATQAEIDSFVLGDPSKRSKLYEADDPIFLGTATLSSSNLSAAKHTVSVGWRMSAQHCDGLGTDLATHCLPAGDTFLVTSGFKVIDGGGK